MLHVTHALDEAARLARVAADRSLDELLAMLRVFALQQTSRHEAPLLVIENVHRLNPSALRALCELAVIRYKQFSALKMVRLLSKKR